MHSNRDVQIQASLLLELLSLLLCRFSAFQLHLEILLPSLDSREEGRIQSVVVYVKDKSERQSVTTLFEPSFGFFDFPCIVSDRAMLCEQISVVQAKVRAYNGLVGIVRFVVEKFN